MHVVAARLGHADPSVTLRVYAHVIQELTPAVAATFAGAVEAAIQGDSKLGLPLALARRGRTELRLVDQTGSG